MVNKSFPNGFQVNYSERQGEIYFRKPFLINSAVEIDENVKRSLQAVNVASDAVYLGVAGTNSLDNLCLIGKDSKHYQQAFLFDTNKRQISAANMLLATIEKSESPEQFIAAFSGEYPKYMQPPVNDKDPDFHRYNRSDDAKNGSFSNVLGAGLQKYQPQNQQELKEYLTAQSDKPDSWISKENYKYIRQMVKTGKIRTVDLDLRDKEQVGEFKGFLAKSGLKTGDIYLSSIKSFMDPVLQTSYYGKSDEKKNETISFYENILSLAGNGGKILLSQAEPGKPFFQDYSIVAVTKKDIEKEFDAIKQSSNSKQDEGKCDYVFSAGGNQWRILSFESEEYGRYYRLLSAKPEETGSGVPAQMKTINNIIKNSFPRDGKIIPIEVADGFDAQFFVAESQKAKAGKVSMVSSVPFTLESADRMKALSQLDNTIAEQLSEKTIGTVSVRKR